MIDQGHPPKRFSRTLKDQSSRRLAEPKNTVDACMYVRAE